MSPKLNVTLLIATGFIGGVLTHYVAPNVVHAQQQSPQLISQEHNVPLITSGGVKLGVLHVQLGGSIGISPEPLVTIRVGKTANTATLEFRRVESLK